MFPLNKWDADDTDNADSYGFKKVFLIRKNLRNLHSIFFVAAKLDYEAKRLGGYYCCCC